MPSFLWQDLMPGALHAGWVRIEEKAANGYPSFKRAFAILWCVSTPALRCAKAKAATSQGSTELV